MLCASCICNVVDSVSNKVFVRLHIEIPKFIGLNCYKNSRIYIINSLTKIGGSSGLEFSVGCNSIELDLG